MNGFMKKMNAKNTSKGRSIFCRELICRAMPNDTKNIMEKKSLKALTLLIISKLYAVFPRIIPAIKAPMVKDKPDCKCMRIDEGKKLKTELKMTPKYSATKENPNKIQTETRNKNSCDFAANLSKGGNKSLLITRAITRRIATFITANARVVTEKLMLESKDTTTIAARSSNNKIPIIIRACKVSNSCLSDNNFTTTIVELKATIMPK